MKSFRLLALSALITVGSVGTVVYTSCTKDECKNVTCLNGGTCSGGTCTCPTGYTGSSCQTRAFVGSWTGSDVCSPSLTTGTIVITLANSTADTTAVVITNAGGYAGTFNGTLSTDAKTITYSNRIVNNTIGGVTYSDTLTGSMTLTSNNAFTHSYIDKQGVSYTCTGTYSRL